MPAIDTLLKRAAYVARKMKALDHWSASEARGFVRDVRKRGPATERLIAHWEAVIKQAEPEKANA